MKYDYDFAIIGAGASGLIAADFALKLGARVAIVEKDRIGGDCTWSGCVPSKSLIKAASVAHAVQHASHFGVGAEAQPTDMPEGAGVAQLHDRAHLCTYHAGGAARRAWRC